jgi:penicillin G amidase
MRLVATMNLRWENPASPWYANLIPLWWDGQYLPVPVPGSVGDGATWTLRG